MSHYSRSLSLDAFHIFSLLSKEQTLPRHDPWDWYHIDRSVGVVVPGGSVWGGRPSQAMDGVHASGQVDVGLERRGLGEARGVADPGASTGGSAHGMGFGGW